MDLGVFLPNGRNGYLISKVGPQFDPSFQHHLAVVKKMEACGMDFGLAMIKFSGFGGETQFWEGCLEGFTLCSALLNATDKIKLFGSAATILMPPPLVARMAATVDSVAPGRFGVNIVTGWQPAEYQQMGMWPGDEYFQYRYDMATEYVAVMRELWDTGLSNFQGEHYQLDNCKLSPRPSGPIDIVAAGQSPRGLRFAAEQADYAFTFCTGLNTPTAFAESNKRLEAAKAESGRDVGAYVLVMVVAEETDALAEKRWKHYSDNIDVAAVSWMADQSARDANADATASAKRINLPEGAVNMNTGALIGGYEKVAKMLDEMAEVPGTKGIMLSFPDYDTDIDVFAEKIQPLMRCRQDRLALA